MKLLFALSLTILVSVCIGGEDFYKMLGVKRTATTREIRRAFKKMAIDNHPDKNRDDPEAHTKFVRINRAYEVLKDEDLRKTYNDKGEEGLEDKESTSGNNYKNYNFYKNEFGIYDEDKEIVTLSKTDFMQQVEHTDELWFVNFYSPQCSHCHALAPTWREVAQDMEGIVRIGAVNCMDEFLFCRQMDLKGYPSLIQYPSNKAYKGDKTKEKLIAYMLEVADVVIHELKGDADMMNENKQLLVTYCGFGDCLSPLTLLKLAAVFKGLVAVATVNCEVCGHICKKHGESEGTHYYKGGIKSGSMLIESLDAKEITDALMKQFPAIEYVSDKEVKLILLNDNEEPWLLHFIDGDRYDFEMRKLPFLLKEDMRVGLVNCEQKPEICSELSISVRPSFAVMRADDGFDIHYGRGEGVADVLAFARNSVSTPCRSLSSEDFTTIVPDPEQMWFVEFFSGKDCPPCMKLLTEFRRASKENEDVMFGTVNCDDHVELCAEFEIEVYPTSYVFNNTEPHLFQGDLTSESLLTFIKDVLKPPVLALTSKSFHSLVTKRAHDQIVLVDFFSPSCPPCLELAPEWRELAKMYSSIDKVTVTSVDCSLNRELCGSQGIESYPNIRIYKIGKDKNAWEKYEEWLRNSYALFSWSYAFVPQVVVPITTDTFEREIVDGKTSRFWLVDYFSPFCGPCMKFSAKYHTVAQALKEADIMTGSIDCNAHGNLCAMAGINHYPQVRLFLGQNDEGFHGVLMDHNNIKDLIKTVKDRVNAIRTMLKGEL